MYNTRAVVLRRSLLSALERESETASRKGESLLQLASEAVARRVLLRELSLPCWRTDQQVEQTPGRYSLLFTNGIRAGVVRTGGPPPPPVDDLLLAKCDLVLVVSLAVRRSGVAGSLNGFVTLEKLRDLERSRMSRAPEAIPLRHPKELTRLVPRSRHPGLHLAVRTLLLLMAGEPDPPPVPGDWKA
jgi:hypothetical protein